VRFSHASAIIEKGRGTAESKIKALEDVEACVVQRPQDIAPAVTKALKAGS
jgi:succinyl-CoA synthetase alpha subunit